MEFARRIICAVALALCFVLGACSGGVVSAEQNRPLKIWFQNENANVSTFVVVDDETKVNYVVVTDEKHVYGGNSTSIAICPRYNADGTLYTGG